MFYTHHELTCICRTLAAASSSSLESAFGSIQLHEAAIDTLPEKEIKKTISTAYHSPLRNARYYLSKNTQVLLKSGHKRFLPNSNQLLLFSSFQSLDLMLPVRLDIQKFLIRQIIHYPHLPFTAVHGISVRMSKS
jgi:hypothetical protein